MVTSLALMQILTLSAISCDVNREKRGRRTNSFSDKSLWKKEYEDELTDAMLNTRRKENVTRVAQSAGSVNEGVIDKLTESIVSAEKYLKKIESIDFRLNRLDIEVHEKANNIMKRLSDILKGLREQGYSDKLETVLDTMKTDINNIKIALEKNTHQGSTASGMDFHSDPSLDNRLATIESNVKAVLTGLDAIVSTMSEVKNRQYTRTFTRPTETSATPETMSMINEFRKILHDQRMKKCECNLRMTQSMDLKQVFWHHKYQESRNVVEMSSPVHCTAMQIVAMLCLDIRELRDMQRVDRAERYPTDCHEIQMQGFNVSGIYKIRPDAMEPFYILCDLTTVGGGWTVFQNRFDGSQDFFKGWADYKYGFGNLAGEFWLGLEKLNYLTNQKLYELRVEVETQHGQEAYASYSVFTLGPEYEGYRISTLGTYYGTAGDSLSYHAGQKFSTPDVDNDEWKDGACAAEHGGAWWYKECDKSNLNGKYTTLAEENKGQSMYWISFKGPNSPLTKTKMMIRPLPATRPIDFGESNRKIIESPKLRPVPELKVSRSKDIKSQGQPQYRYEDPGHDVFFPNYAR